MKKLIVLLLAFVVATSAFAQLTINGYSRGTVTVSAGTTTTSTMLYRLRLNMSYNDPSGNFGAWARLQSDGFATPAFKYGYAWAKFGTMLKVSAGQLGNYDYGVYSGTSDFKLGNLASDLYIGDATDGILAQFYPVDGLNVGLTYLPNATVSGSDFNFNAKYSVSNVGNFFVGFRPSDATNDIFASGTFEFTGMQGLDLAVGFQYGGNGFWHGYVAKQMTVLGNVTYSQGPFAVQVAPVYDITDSKLYTEGYVNYKVTPAAILKIIGAYDQASVMLGTGSTYFMGAELYYTVGKGYAMTGVWYDQAAGFTIPVSVKVVF
jgi:hypothetical protein